MTNTKKLMNRIKQSGYKISYLAKELGLSSYGLMRKVQNESEFKTSELDKLSRLLRIETWEEKAEIFFAKELD